jgi:ureidoacrylate peracid hydrolase
MDAALLVIDMQNGFVHPDGSTITINGPLPNVDKVIAETASLLEEARGRGLPVIYTRHQFRKDFLDAPPKLLEMFPTGVKPLVEGTWDAAVLDELAPADGDTMIDKNRFDAFLYTDLEIVLRALGVKKLLVTGVVTNVCVESTVRSGQQRDFVMTVASDCTAAAAGFHDPALNAMAEVFATVTTWREGLDGVLA